jgi:succinoglycan biosynthesis protein ExoM
MNPEVPIMPSAHQPLVSVVMANHNGARYLAEAVASVQRQSLRDLELIVSDDASSDDSVTIVRSLMVQDHRIRLIRGKRNVGPAAARNSAIAIAKGAWIAIMDSDDVMHESRLARLVDAAVADRADIAADDLIEFDKHPSQSGRSFLTGRWARAASWIDIAEYIARNCFYGPGPTLGYLKPLFRTSSFAHEALRYDESLRVGEDCDLVLRLLHAGGNFRVYPFALYYYRKHSASISHRLNENVLAAIQVADRRLCAQIGGGDRRLTMALARRTRSIDTALAYERLLNALKTRDWRRTLEVALANPRAAALLRLPVAARLDRLTSSLVRRVRARPGQATRANSGARHSRGPLMSAVIDSRRAPTRAAGGPDHQPSEPAAANVAVCICTFRRPSSLRAAMESVARQTLPEGVLLTLIIIDNDQEATARPLVDGFRAKARFPVEYRHCPGENISIARNAALDAVEAPWLAFVDDDEHASHSWLAELLAARTGAQAVFGPCEALYRRGTPIWMRRGDFHSNRISRSKDVIDTGYTSNVLVDMTFVRRHGLRFDVALGRSGGEDTIFFHAMHHLGAVLKYAPRAIVYEEVAASRTNARWIVRRRYRAGQTYAMMLRRFSPRRYSLSKWTSPLKIATCVVASAFSALNSARASRWIMRGIFHIGVLSFAVGLRVHQEYGDRERSAS